jgi:glycine dehydrogenase subunit 2
VAEYGTIFEAGGPGRRAYSLPECDVPEVNPESVLPPESLRGKPAELPEVSEPTLVRHFINLSVLNHHIDRDFYPLGSCTMKYNPKASEAVAGLEGFAGLHPLVPEALSQGALGLIHELGRALCEVTGMDDITMVPAAGAHGEFAGMLMVRAYHEDRGKPRSKVLIPDSAHGTNPASVKVAGYDAVEVKSGSDGRIDPDDVRAHLDEEVAAIMITNPNTLGLFETHMCDVAKMVHDAGGLVYMDGANMNALLGISRPGDFGVDIAHLNLHKTFSTPHGGGGPGSGPVAVKDSIAPYLPLPVIEEKDGVYALAAERPKSIGRIHTFSGNFGVMVKAYNANYLLALLKDHFQVPYGGVCKHEFVLSGKDKLAHGVRTLDIAKRLMDYGFHPPTIYFPLIVDEALMIEPTETESIETLERFAEAMKAIAGEIETDPEKVKGSPCSTPVRRVDEGLAARKLDVAE